MSTQPKFTQPLKAMPQPGQTEGVHTYTHCVMHGDDAIATTLTKADAYLYAAAPKMYAELESISASLSMEFPNWQATVRRIDALLAEARGEE